MTSDMSINIILIEQVKWIEMRMDYYFSSNKLDQQIVTHTGRENLQRRRRQTFSWDQIEKFEKFSLNTCIQFNDINTSWNIRFTRIRLKNISNRRFSSNGKRSLQHMYHWNELISLEVNWMLTYPSIVEERFSRTSSLNCSRIFAFGELWLNVLFHYRIMFQDEEKKFWWRTTKRKETLKKLFFFFWRKIFHWQEKAFQQTLNHIRQANGERKEMPDTQQDFFLSLWTEIFFFFFFSIVNGQSTIIQTEWECCCCGFDEFFSWRCGYERININFSILDTKNWSAHSDEKGVFFFFFFAYALTIDWSNKTLRKIDQKRFYSKRKRSTSHDIRTILPRPVEIDLLGLFPEGSW